MLNPSQFRHLIIRPALQRLGPAFMGLAAENLLLGTALTESGLEFLHQVGGGPALGLYQCEPATHQDIWTNYLNASGPIVIAVRVLMNNDSPLDQLVYNLAYATAMCRIHYRRAPDALPAEHDAVGLAWYHKRHYNSMLGATDPNKSVINFARAIATE